jgi:hypothetical protein
MADQKKLIVDEDWKSQVQAEKQQAQQGSSAAAGSASANKPSNAREPQEPADFQMPPASFELLLTTLGTEALMAMGQLPHPGTGQTHVHRNQATYLIDTIDVLREKTAGNLTPDEQQLIESLLHQLRLVFLQTSSDVPGGAEAGR